MQACGRLVGDESDEPADDRLDRHGLGLADRTAVAGELEVGQHAAYGIELRPGRARLVGQRQPTDEAVALEAVGLARRRGGWPRAPVRSRRPPPAGAWAWARPRPGSRSRRWRPARRGRARRRAPRPATAGPPPRPRRSPRGRAPAVFISAIWPLESRSRVAVATSPPATGAVDTTAVPRSSSARLATSGWRVMRTRVLARCGGPGHGTCARSCPAPPRSRRLPP